MPKFTEQEKVQVHQNLMDKGRTLFIKNGLVKTSIDDIVQACKIGKGTFYKFFPSKEALYFAILKNEEEVRDAVLLQLYKEALSPTELIESFFHTSFLFVEDNAFLQRAFEQDERELLMRKLPEEMAVFHQWNQERGIQAINMLIERGVLPEQDPKVAVGILQAMLTLRLHKNEIGDGLFPQVMDRMVKMIAEGLTKK